MRALVLLLVLGAAACEPAPRSAARESLAGEIDPIVLLVHPAAAAAPFGGPVFNGEVWHLDTSRVPIRYPLPLEVGDQILGWVVYLSRYQAGPLTTAQLQRLGPGAEVSDPVGMAASDNTPIVGQIVLRMALDQPQQVGVGDSYSIMLAGDGIAGDRAGGAMVRVVRPGY